MGGPYYGYHGKLLRIDLTSQCVEVEGLLERVINAREGVRREDDKLPERLTGEPIQTGPSQGQRVRDFEKMKDEFYQVCGWDLKTGIPTREHVEKLGIPWVLEGIR